MVTKKKGPKSDIPPNIAPKLVTPENYLQIWDSSAKLIGQLAIVVKLFGAILGGIPLSGAYPIRKIQGTPRYRFFRRTNTVRYFNLAVFFLAVPGTSFFGGTDFGGSWYFEIWR